MMRYRSLNSGYVNICNAAIIVPEGRSAQIINEYRSYISSPRSWCLHLSLLEQEGRACATRMRAAMKGSILSVNS